MALGATIRSLFGPYEHQVTDAYRAVFVDLDDWMKRISEWVPNAANILEIGCGEGAMTERLARHYPEAKILAIYVTPRLGRLYRGDGSKVTFRQVEVETIAQEMPEKFDLVATKRCHPSCASQRPHQPSRGCTYDAGTRCQIHF